MKFEDMEVWKRSSRLCVNVYKHCADLKDYGFRDQITRSSLSIPSNIAEGLERSSSREKLNFLNYSKGSCAELRTQIYIGMEIGYIPSISGSEWIRQTEEISSMITGLAAYLNTLP